MEDECGYCLSSMQCLPGVNSSGPIDGTPCDQWTFTMNSCPGIFVFTLFYFLILKIDN